MDSDIPAPESATETEREDEAQPAAEPLEPKQRAATTKAGDYRIVVLRDLAKGDFVARAPELECQAEAPSRSEAVSLLEEEIEARLANMKAGGHTVPPSVEDVTAFSGELALRVPRGLHRDLMWQARYEGVPVDQLATELLGRAMEARLSARPGGGRRFEGGRDMRAGREREARERGGSDGSRYHGIMDDRAHFIEYVRGLDAGPQAGRGRGGGGGGRHR